MKRILFSLGLVASTAISVLCSVFPFNRAMSKHGALYPETAAIVLAIEVIPSLIIGLAICALAACLIERRPPASAFLLVAAPVIVLLSQPLLRAIA